MNRYFIMLCFVVSGTLVSRGQIFQIATRNLDTKYTIDSCNFQVNYLCRFLKDTASKIEYTDHQNLDIGEKFSTYYSRSFVDMDSVMWRFGKANANKIDAAENPRRNLPIGEEPWAEQWLFDHSEMGGIKLYCQILKFDYQCYEPMPQSQWEIMPDTMNILGYMCQKAKTTFSGRIWTAWFTPRIPISAGPWKLRGLPGIILKATDDNNLFDFTAIGITQPNNEKIYWWNTKLTSITRKQYLKLQRMQWEDRAGFTIMHGVRVMVTDGKGKVIEVKAGDLQEPYISPLELE